MILLKTNNQTWRPYRGSLINENKWRAMKSGVHSHLIDFSKQKEISFKDLFYEMMEFIEDVVDPLGSRKQIDYLETMISSGSSADRQLNKYENNNNLNDVVDSLISETLEGC